MINSSMLNLKEIRKLPFIENISFPCSLEISRSKKNIQPLLVAENKDKEFFLIDGYKRYRFLVEEGIDDFICVTVKKIANEKSEELLLEHVQYNIERGFNDIEVANLILSAETFFPQYPLLKKKLFSLLNLKFSMNNENKFKKLANLSEKCKKAYIDNFLHKNTGLRLSELNGEEQDMILELFKNLRLNGNKQKNVFNMFSDLSKRLNISISELIKRFFKNFLLPNLSNNNYKLFFEKLLKIHSPDYFEFNKKFLLFKKLLMGNGQGFNLLNPSNFEDTNYKLEIFFENIEELQKKLDFICDNLEKLERKNEFKELFQ